MLNTEKGTHSVLGTGRGRSYSRAGNGGRVARGIRSSVEGKRARAHSGQCEGDWSLLSTDLSPPLMQEVGGRASG